MLAPCKQQMAISSKSVCVTTFPERYMFASESTPFCYADNRPKMRTFIYTTDLNYWIKHPFEFSDPILKPEYL